MYYQQVITFLQEFPNTKVVLFDDFVRSPDSILMELMGFLEIEKTYLDAARDFRYNVSGIPKYRKLDYFVSEANLLKSLLKPVMNKMMSKDARYKLKNLIRNTYIVKHSMKRETRNRLISIYKEDISRLQSLLGRDLSNWTSMES